VVVGRAVVVAALFRVVVVARVGVRMVPIRVGSEIADEKAA
jgi:hypothetical protein